MERFIRLSLLSASFVVSSVLAFGQYSGSPAPNGALPNSDPGNQGYITRAVQWGKDTGMSRLTTKTAPAATCQWRTAQEERVEGPALCADYPPANATGFANEMIFVQNPGDAAFRK